MQKTFLKFVVFELLERTARFRLLLNEAADSLHESAPTLYAQLQQEATELEAQLLSHKTALNRLFAESGAASKGSTASIDPVIHSAYEHLQALSRLLVRVTKADTISETHIFLKDSLPSDLLKSVGEQSVFLVEESPNPSLGLPSLPGVLMDSLSVLQKNNPLAWVGLTQAYSQHLLESSSVLESMKIDLVKGKKASNLTDEQAERLITHAVNLRLLGPAYYFHTVSNAYFAQDAAFLQVMEPALFFGLNHQNVTHKSLVILHEACERSKPEADGALLPLAEETLANLFRAVEKAVPAKFAFQEKHFQRAIQLQERVAQGVLLSSTALFPVEEVSDTLQETQGKADFSIYNPLSMLTEYPHTPREIVNAGWLHRFERGPVWLYSVLNEERESGYDSVVSLLDYQDELLRKSIEVSEIHRVLLTSQ